MTTQPLKQTLKMLPGVPLQVADHLTELIIRGELAPGERIPEARITASLGVSRGSVREAMQILERRHLVELRPRRGAVVTEMSEKSTRDLYAAMIPLYITLARAAASVWQSPEDLAALHEVSTALDGAISGDLLELINISNAVVDAACTLADNDYLTRLMLDLRPVFSRSFYFALAAGNAEFDRLRDLLAQLIRNIQRRDVDALTELLTRYGEHQLAAVLGTL